MNTSMTYVTRRTLAARLSEHLHDICHEENSSRDLVNTSVLYVIRRTLAVRLSEHLYDIRPEENSSSEIW